MRSALTRWQSTPSETPEFPSRTVGGDRPNGLKYKTEFATQQML
jgi:hypothetical protein